jgi:hypothetical protein
MKTRRWIGLMTVLLVTLAGSSALGADSPLGKSYYTRCNIWYENPKAIMSTNFHKGGRLPVGTKVKILGLGEGKVTFLDEGTGTMALIYVRRHTQVSFQEFFDRHFDERDPRGTDGVFNKLTKSEQVNIETGAIAAGMSKDAVLMAYGYPPSHRTPDLKADKWSYWKGRNETVVVNFDKEGKVKGEKLEGTPDIAATYAMNPVGKQYFTRVNIWVEDPAKIFSINYHKGKMIPVGTQVEIVDFGDDEIRFVVGDEKGEYTIVHLTRYSNVGLEQIFNRYFTEEDVTAAGGALQKFLDTERENIKKGAIAEGMSKEAVLMAYGYPPGHRTPDLDHHIWTFWQSRGKRLIIYFRNDRVIAIDTGNG